MMCPNVFRDPGLCGVDVTGADVDLEEVVFCLRHEILQTPRYLIVELREFVPTVASDSGGHIARPQFGRHSLLSKHPGFS